MAERSISELIKGISDDSKAIAEEEIALAKAEATAGAKNLGIGAGLAVVVAALSVWLAFRMRAGKGWARTLLDLAAIFLLVDAVSVVVGVFGGMAIASSGGEVVTFVALSCRILAGLCAATAVWRQHTAESMQFTSGGPRAGA